MLYEEFKANKDNEHKKQGNPSVLCNAVYKTQDSFNCYMTPTEAIDLARGILMKAQLILERGIEDGVVQLWNAKKGSRRLLCGIEKAVKKTLKSTH